MTPTYLRQKLYRKLASKRQQPLTKATLANLDMLSDSMMQQLYDYTIGAETYQLRFVVRLIKDGYNEEFLSDVITYASLINGREYLAEWFLSALDRYRRYSWYPPVTDASAVPKIKEHLEATRKVTDEVLRYWHEHSSRTDETTLTHIGVTSRNRQLWALSDERLVQHLYERPEDAYECKRIINDRGTISYSLLHSIMNHFPLSLSEGTL